MRRTLILLLFIGKLSFGQNTIALDSLDNDKSAKDSITYSKLRNKMYKSRIGKQIYRAVFKDVYNSNRNRVEISKITVNPFEAHEGKIIGKISIKQLNIFGQSVNDTTRKGTRLEEFASKAIHINTREKVIRNSLLLFKEGDKLNAQLLKENERLIRTNSIIHDTRILVVTRADVDWIVDIEIIVQDVFSISISGGLNWKKSIALGIEEKNYLGLGHSLLGKITILKNDPFQVFGFRTIYSIPYIGRSFVSAQAKIINERDFDQYSFQINRPFYSVETKNAGSLEFGYNMTRTYKKLAIDNNRDSSLIYPVSYYYSDAWYGRAFNRNSNQKNKKIILAVRRIEYEYLKRPEVRADTNNLYWNRNTYLASIGFSNRSYQRDILIYGFGRTEDVPIGNLFSLTVGKDNTEFGQRYYSGIQFAKGKYLPYNRGYLYLLANLGSYLTTNTNQQGVIGVQGFYFSRLLQINKTQTRHFLNLGFTYGINRDEVDYLNISGKDGIVGVNSEYLRGDKRLTIGYEAVAFSKKTIVGFRIAYFGFINMGLVNLKNKALFRSTLYQGYGLGLRIRNENLAISTFQIRLGYYPNIPNLSQNIRFAFDSSQPLRLRDFDISAPTIIPLQ